MTGTRHAELAASHPLLRLHLLKLRVAGVQIRDGLCLHVADELVDEARSARPQLDRLRETLMSVIYGGKTPRSKRNTNSVDKYGAERRGSELTFRT